MNPSFKASVSMLFAVIVLAVDLLGGADVPAQATVITDKGDYPPFSVVAITGAGFQPGEIVSNIVVQKAGPAAGAEYKPWSIVADESGGFETEWFVFGEELAGTTLELRSTGLTSSRVASTSFTDAEALALFENSGRTAQRDAYAWGQNIYARLKGIPKSNRTFCYKVEWLRPDGTIATTLFLEPVAGANRDISTFTLPATGPSGKWTLRTFRATITGVCAGKTYNALPTASVQFDVARAVIVGGDSPCAKPGSADLLGGDNFVDQTGAQANVIQANGLGAALDVRSRSSANKRAFVRFNLAGLPGNITVSDAKLRLFMSTAPKVARTENLQPVAATWSEGAITWMNQPAVSSTLLASSAVPANSNNTLIYWSGAALKTNVQNLVVDPAGNYGWRIADASEGQGGNDNNLARFRSTEADGDTGNCPIKKNPNKMVWPVLLLDYTDTCTPAPTVSEPLCEGTTLVSGTSSESNGTVVEVFVNDVSAGSTVVTGGTWARSVSALFGGDQVTAKATAAGRCTSGASFQVTVGSSSTAPTAASASTNSLCSGDTSTLTVAGGELGVEADWVWYSGDPVNGVVEGIGDTIDVTPAGSTTYYVRAEGCNITTSVSVTVTMRTPAITCPPSQTLLLGDGCLATLPDYTALAAVIAGCSTNISVTQSPAPGTTVIGTTPLTVSLTADDGISNPVQCSFPVNPVNVPPELFFPRRTGSVFQVSMVMLSGRMYVLEFANVLTNTTWTPLPPGVVGDATVKTLTDTAADAPQRFYRVRITCP